MSGHVTVLSTNRDRLQSTCRLTHSPPAGNLDSWTPRHSFLRVTNICCTRSIVAFNHKAIMRWHKLQVLAAIALWAGVSSGSNIPHICPRTGVDVNELGSKLSSNAKVYLPGSAEFAAATTRWSNLEAPQVNIVVVPGTENDVAEAVCRSIFPAPLSLLSERSTGQDCKQIWCAILGLQRCSRSSHELRQDGLRH